MKKLILTLLVMCLLVTGVSAAAAGDARTVIGADLTQEQVASVYKTFGIERGGVKELTVTNAEERSYLAGMVDESVIGTRSISCVYVVLLEEGAGYEMRAENINWCTEEMYLNALVTAGLSDVRVVVSAPFAVSGTAALTGIYKAYEDLTGEKLDEVAKLVGTQELVTTAELAEELGKYDASQIVNELKLILDQTKGMTDEALREEILRIAAEYKVTLTDAQIGQLVELCRMLEKLNDAELVEKVKSVQETVKKLAELGEKAATFREKVSEITESVEAFFGKVRDFFANLFGRG